MFVPLYIFQLQFRLSRLLNNTLHHPKKREIGLKSLRSLLIQALIFFGKFVNSIVVFGGGGGDISKVLTIFNFHSLSTSNTNYDINLTPYST